MNEWATLLLVFWLLWLIDGWKLPPVARFGLAGGLRHARLRFARVLPPAWLPTGWTAVAADIPFVLSPAGLCNRPAGSAGRPADAPGVAAAWAWADIKEVAVKDGWIEINGRRFCRDTGHLNAPQLLALAWETDAARPARIAWWIRRWLRPAHLRRRAWVLGGHSAISATANTLFLLLAAVVTLYLTGMVAHRLPLAWADLGGRLLPLLAGYLALLHGVAVVAAGRALRRLKAVQPEKRGSAWFTALLLPPQALRLRALLGEGFFPAQHPLAYALAFAAPAQLRELAFDTLSDLRWPLGAAGDTPLAQEITGWYRTELAGQLVPLLRAAGIKEAALLAAPAPEGSASVSYCPRCQCQFTGPRTHCPQGIELQPVAKV